MSPLVVPMIWMGLAGLALALLTCFGLLAAAIGRDIVLRRRHQARVLGLEV